MSNSPWTITRSKRKSIDPEYTTRKRTRVSFQVEADERLADTTSTKKLHQQTLTQAQWTPSPKDDSISPVAGSENNRDEPRKTPRTGTSKRANSTLTQMDFFKTPVEEMDDLDKIQLEGRSRGNRTSAFLNQYDGGNESFVLDVKRRSEPPKFPSKSSPKKKRKIEVALDETIPGIRTRSKRRSLPSNDENRSIGLVDSDFPTKNWSDTGLESSRTDEPEHHAYATPVLTASMSSDIQIYSPSKIPVKRSYTPQLPQPKSVVAAPYSTLRTPNKRDYVIPSSQSPETLSPASTRRAKRSLSYITSPVRQPLRERSTNLSLKPAKITKKRQRSKPLPLEPDRLESDGEVYQASTPKDRILHNLTSVNSPRRQKISVDELRHQGQLKFSDLTAVTALSRNSSGLEIRESEQESISYTSKPGKRAQSSESTRQTRNKTIASNNESLIQEENNKCDVPVGSDVEVEVAKVDVYDPQLFKRQNTVPDSQDEFGSPIRNDTQFVDLIARYASPAILNARQECLAPVTEVVTDPPIQLADTNKAGSDSRPEIFLTSIGTLPEVMLPTASPQVVEKTGNTTISHQETLDQAAETNQSHSSVRSVRLRSAGGMKRKIHKKNFFSSSSPPSDASTVSAHLQPASVPHPSQISTQEPTQGIFLLSSPKVSDPVDRGTIETLTVKDSSSSAVRMSQIPPYVPDSEDSDIDLDFDLPPKPTRPHRRMLTPIQLDFDTTPKSKVSRTITAGLDETTAANPTTPITRSHSKHGEIDINNEKIVPIDSNEAPPSSMSTAEFMSSSPPLPPLQKDRYSPLPGFDNDTQSNYTQGGHITAAYVHRARESGLLESWWIPRPYRLENFAGRSDRKGKRKGKKATRTTHTN